MSRLDNMIRRLTAQKLCLEAAVELIKNVPGPVLEIGLGKGRTFDHLREILPNREIFVFDRQIVSFPECTPDMDHIIFGDFRETLPYALPIIKESAALAHCDFASGNTKSDEALAIWLARALQRVMKRGSIIVSDRKMEIEEWKEVALPDGVKKDRYFIYRQDSE